MMKHVIVALLGILSITGCSGSKTALSNREKYICSQCHKLPFPEQHTAEQWPAVVARMVEHMRVNNRTMPDAKEQQEIINFYQANAAPAVPATQ